MVGWCLSLAEAGPYLKTGCGTGTIPCLLGEGEPRMEIAPSYDSANVGIQILGIWLFYVRACILHVRKLSIELLA
jgi:hypothetical protein